jgi:poly(A) polymerase
LLGGSPRNVADALAELADWAVPQLPVKGGMLVARGVTVGPQVARLLRLIEERWVAADFPQGAALDRLVDQALSEARQ